MRILIAIAVAASVTAPGMRIANSGDAVLIGSTSAGENGRDGARPLRLANGAPSASERVPNRAPSASDGPGTGLQAPALALGARSAPADAADAATRPAVRFEAVDVCVDAGDTPLAAYQFELAAEVGEITIVGVEGGEHAAFKERPPYYDPAARMNNRIIIAAFNTGQDLPTGKTRVARIHLQVGRETEPKYVVKLHTAASADGKRIPATVTVCAISGE